ncbi:hypothetical protein C7447_101726 [Tenacibaculum adriaticum]|uniref:PAP2 superfamily protein n=1 Tax=Tenacibaculum adriaticum TaxID=413713 RepID=A0A5S5DYK2_9FLAO|nr:hypothetical protein [Tenacibaculum adriaticum]TYQ00117.1 hypothetical protein C7447_101726 [Tenacibaculum adriaticum]
MRWYKFISAILHPIVMPTVGVLLFFILSEVKITREQQLAVLSMVFISTYIIPILLLIFLRAIGVIETYQVKTIPERKIPILFMTGLFFFVGKSLMSTSVTREFSYLFYGTSLSLTLVYFIFLFKEKTSLHLLSMGNAVGYFLLFQQSHNISILPVILVLIILSGLLASSRLYLKAHTPREVYMGFFIGVISQFLVFWVL